MFDNLKPVKYGVAVGTIVCIVAGCGEGKSKVTERAAPTYGTPEVVTTPVTPTEPIQVEDVQDEPTGYNEPGVVKTSTQDASGLGTFSVGYRVGQITKFSVKGMVSKSGEGQMLMGRESTPYVITYSCGENNNSTCRKTINPWKFSMDKRDARLMEPYVGEYVWTKYTQSNVKSPAFDTDYIINEIGQIDRATQLRTCVDPSADGGSKSKGVRVGRIVKASMKGTFSKTGEVMMQVGNAGNQFKNMSVTSKMFECAVTALKTADKVKVHYKQGWFRNPFSSDTTYAVWKIEPVGDI